jgi:outer membrane protein TolC
MIYTERPVIYLRNENASPKLNDVKFGGRFGWDAAINAAYPVLNPVNQSNLRIAGIAEQISQQELTHASENLALSVAQVYLTVLLQQSQQQLLLQSLERNERALNDARSLFLQGKGLKTDTLSTYISVQQLKASLAALDNSKLVLLVQLKQLMGLEQDSAALVLTDSLDIMDPLSRMAEGGLAQALQNRKDLKWQVLQQELAKEELVKVQAGYKPQLAAIAQYQVQNQSDNLNPWNGGIPRSSFAGLRLSIPIYSGNKLKYQAAQSKLSIQQAALAVEDLKSSIQTELVSLQANLKAAYDQWQIQQQNVEAAQINYTMMNDRYRNGLGSRLELTDAELALTRSRMEYIQSVYAINLVELQLKKAMGLLTLQ